MSKVRVVSILVGIVALISTSVPIAKAQVVGEHPCSQVNCCFAFAGVPSIYQDENVFGGDDAVADGTGWNGCTEPVISVTISVTVFINGVKGANANTATDTNTVETTASTRMPYHENVLYCALSVAQGTNIGGLQYRPGDVSDTACMGPGS